jgi:flagellar hook-basal body complex protein FliE
MTMAIDPVSAALPLTPPTPATNADATADSGFADTLHQILGSVESSSAKANDAISHMLDGTGDIHEAMIAMQQADTTLQLTVQIRNKLVQAYQSVMGMTS